MTRLARARQALGTLIKQFVPGLAPVTGGGGWYPIVREPFSGAWQQNAGLTIDGTIANPTVFTCTTQIASDIAKMRLRLVASTADGIWTETTNPAYSPVLRRPNRYEVTPKLIERWILSKLVWGNAYLLKERDDRGVVRALYVLHPMHVVPLIAPDGAIYYGLSYDPLVGVTATDLPGVPASEIIHDRMYPLFHPLIGLSPIFACGIAAMSATYIQTNSMQFFANGATPGGVILAPMAINQDTADRLAENWMKKYTGPNVGKVAVLSGGLKYEKLTANAVDTQLIEQLHWTAETICGCYHMPVELVMAHETAHRAWTPEQLTQLYYTECLQNLVVNLEACLDDGLGLDAVSLGTELDIDDLIWMDTTTKTKAAESAIGAGALSPNEARAKYFGVGPVTGGETPYMQQQNFSLAALAERDADQPFAKAAAPPPATSATPADGGPVDEAATAAFLEALIRATQDLCAS